MMSILNDLKSLNIISRIPAPEEICYAPNLKIHTDNEY
jgi:hypothetical protein